MKRNKYFKAVSVLEYSILVVVVAATVLGIQIYLKRGISGRWRETADIFGHGRIYDVKTPEETKTSLFWEDNK